MSETSQIINDTLARLFEERFTPEVINGAEAQWCADEWAELVELGLPLAMVAEEQGGVGLSPAEALELLRLVGRYGVPLPLGETMLANHLAARAGLDMGLLEGTGVATVAPVRPQDQLGLVREEDGYRLTGIARRVPWGGKAEAISAVASLDGVPHLVLVQPATDGGVTVQATGHNLAGEPRDDLSFDVVVPAGRVAALKGELADDVLALGAAMRAQMIAGAAESALEMTVQYANERVQFGRAIGKFQAIQQNLAMVAGQVAAAAGGADVAASAIERSQAGEAADVLSVGAGKSRASEAAGIVAGIAHQVHGAIGFTHEHSLHHRTRRLWSWRDEFGDEAYWNRRLGAAMAKAGADGLWPFLTTL